MSTATEYKCVGCGEVHDGTTALAHSETCGPLFPQERKLRVADKVTLHAFKSHSRREGVVTAVRRTRCDIAIRTLDGYPHTTTRDIADPDLRLAVKS